MASKFHPYIDAYLHDMRTGTQCKEIRQAADYVERKLSQPFVVIENHMIDRAVQLIEKYFPFKLAPWELFVIACIHAYDSRSDTVIFDEILLEMGRGNGKNGFISAVTWYLTTPAHGVNGYNVDIIANSEDQAKTSFADVYDLIEDDKTGKLKKQYDATKVEITNLKTNSYIRFNTSNAKTKDGKRTACIVFDEIHEYEDWSMFEVFTSGLGKKKHSRTFYITTNGFVRGGFLDQQLKLAHDVLSGEADDLGLLPLIYKLDDKEEVKDESNWVKANPSLPYLPLLLQQMRKDYKAMQYRPSSAVTFFTKRMNIPAQDTFNLVATPEQIRATNRPIPYEKLEDLPCIGTCDYASIRDFCSCGLLFQVEGLFYFIEHTFVCHKALEIESRQFKFPVEEMAERGLITILQTDTIKAETVANWFLEKAETYGLIEVRADKYRLSLLEKAFGDVGIPLTSVRSGPQTHTLLSPLIDSIFADNKLVLGDNPTMRWYINNVRQEMDKKGNISYVKIEPQLRKTDGFFSLLHGLTGVSELPDCSLSDDDYEMKPLF